MNAHVEEDGRDNQKGKSPRIVFLFAIDAKKQRAF